MKIIFSKYHGTGNDFIMVNDPENKIQLTTGQVKKLCDRRFGIGADGLILLRSRPGFDFEMVYFNSDGNESSMCGNGGRCITAFAKTHGRAGTKVSFFAFGEKYVSEIISESPMIVRLKMLDISNIEDGSGFVYLDTGSPHYVRFVNDVSSVDIIAEGRKVRNSERFRKEGTNVNFVQTSDGELLVRTYERGVEDETLSCGTGVTASAIAASFKNEIDSKKKVADIVTPGGKLKVYFEKNGNGFKNIWLEGGATFVFDGEIEIE